MSIIKLPLCSECGVPHVPDEVASRVRSGEDITIEIIPYSNGLVKNVLVHGTGGLNIDACRIGGAAGNGHWTHKREIGNGTIYHGGGREEVDYGSINPSGKRFPSNTLFSHTLYCRQTGVKRVRGNRWSKGNERHGKDGQSIFNMGQHIDTIGYEDPDGMETIDAWECDPSCPVRILGEQSGVRKSGGRVTKAGTQASMGGWREWSHANTPTYANDYQLDASEGTAARYFAQFSPSPDELEAPFIYAPKASRAERNRGCEGLPEKASRKFAGGEFIAHPEKPATTSFDRVSHNTHPCVKSLQLMKYLCRLVGVPGGVILDPFMGSGSTGVAALQEGFGFIGIEQSEEYCTIANARIAHAMQEAGVAEVQGDGEWECHESCPVRILGEQSGVRHKTGAPNSIGKPYAENNQVYGKIQSGAIGPQYYDTGTAARYFAQFAPDSLWSELNDEDKNEQ